MLKIRKAETNGKLDFFTELESRTIHILTIHQVERDQEKCFGLSGRGRQTGPDAAWHVLLGLWGEIVEIRRR